MCDTCTREYRNHMIVVVQPFDKMWKIKKYCKTLIFGTTLSYDVASGSEITPCIKIDKPLVVYRLSGTCNVMKSCP